MRDLLFKNLTSMDKKRKIIASYETLDKNGVRSIIRRHFICILKEVKDVKTVEKPDPYLSVIKARNTKEHTEKFFCRMKGSVIAIYNNRLYLIVFMHTLKISLEAVTNSINH